jgi:heme A synthase
VRGQALFRWLSVASFAACYVTILVGGNVIASDAGLGCPDWPTCHGQIVPALSGATGVEFSHRVAALGLSGLVLALAIVALLAERSRPALVRLSLAALATVVLEALLGGVVVASDLVVAIVLVHFAIATVLFVLLMVIAVLANYRELPPRWRRWAGRAMDGAPAEERDAGGVGVASEGPGRPIGAAARAWSEERG